MAKNAKENGERSGNTLSTTSNALQHQFGDSQTNDKNNDSSSPGNTGPRGAQASENANPNADGPSSEASDQQQNPEIPTQELIEVMKAELSNATEIWYDGVDRYVECLSSRVVVEFIQRRA